MSLGPTDTVTPVPSSAAPDLAPSASRATSTLLPAYYQDDAAGPASMIGNHEERSFGGADYDYGSTIESSPAPEQPAHTVGSYALIRTRKKKRILMESLQLYKLKRRDKAHVRDLTDRDKLIIKWSRVASVKGLNDSQQDAILCFMQDELKNLHHLPRSARTIRTTVEGLFDPEMLKFNHTQSMQTVRGKRLVHPFILEMLFLTCCLCAGIYRTSSTKICLKLRSRNSCKRPSSRARKMHLLGSPCNRRCSNPKMTRWSRRSTGYDLLHGFAQQQRVYPRAPGLLQLCYSATKQRCVWCSRHA